MESKDVLIIAIVVISMACLFVYLIVAYTKEINKYNKEREEELRQQDLRKHERRFIAHAEQMSRIRKAREIETRIHVQGRKKD